MHGNITVRRLHRVGKILGVGKQGCGVAIQTHAQQYDIRLLERRHRFVTGNQIAGEIGIQQ